MSGMQYSYVIGGRVFKSLIDIDNIPSIQIHESLGFEKGSDAISCLIYE
jgi:L-amino acid N-acyltransferase YncA